ncbi:uncharacterized protein SPPG_06023 [Spizellomyces punctatus DAOM BR117]|uniref:Uncharacterized protein n=1 Tax=Spizellomyces punctatus (strain DAOM BR117) TaxID=645134 RepID=A0A0L0HDL1_SPIPD|nr:uncharacterized protein SPPG_06023 [Spizellomyces punctatus DAOM BR117]KNC99076.1 hypothetical protein SPPG_06023 [Spizellomyces punctatus DAOM BR117]|eukprot:XP_016607116.1 hypothetical protein SPPG_06023 [Spizellomyces punctatus DAOM BR117]
MGSVWVVSAVFRTTRKTLAESLRSGCTRLNKQLELQWNASHAACTRSLILFKALATSISTLAGISLSLGKVLAWAARTGTNGVCFTCRKLKSRKNVMKRRWRAAKMKNKLKITIKDDDEGNDDDDDDESEEDKSSIDVCIIHCSK